MKIITEEPAEQKTGHWCISPDGWYPYCSECYIEPKSKERTKFCPNCGAEMTDAD